MCKTVDYYLQKDLSRPFAADDAAGGKKLAGAKANGGNSHMYDHVGRRKLLPGNDVFRPLTDVAVWSLVDMNGCHSAANPKRKVGSNKIGLCPDMCSVEGTPIGNGVNHEIMGRKNDEF